MSHNNEDYRFDKGNPFEDDVDTYWDQHTEQWKGDGEFEDTLDTVIISVPQIVKDTGKAILIIVLPDNVGAEVDVWLPKSQIEIEYNFCEPIIIKMPEWLFAQHPELEKFRV